MLASADTAYLILNWLVCMVIVFTVVDICLVHLIKTYKPLLENKYFSFHRRHGFLKVTVLKVVLALIIMYLLLNPTFNTVKLVGPVAIHGLMVTKLLIDFIRKQ